VDYFASEYIKGRTPNPCIACNEHIKFRLFLDRARKMGFDAIATGHYASLEKDPATGRLVIAEGVDVTKDQSYVLFPLKQDLLKDLFLPLGGYTKKEIREKAGRLGLCVTNKPDSQEICFIPSNDYREFMTKEFPDKEAGVGNIVTPSGEIIGQHEGYFHYTRGQRRGLGVAYKERLYVLETRPKTNEVVVGTKDDVFGLECRIGRMNWFVSHARERNDPRSTFQARVKIRSQHSKALAMVTILSDDQAEILFDEPQDAITPGQGAAIYDGSRILAGGWIDSVG
jgi:tRNA-specific 2-thiouridylase